MNVASKNEMDGSFQFCEGCPTSLNCCSRMNHKSFIENAVVFGDEVNSIESFSGVPRNQFLKESSFPGTHPLQTIANAETGGCIFHRDGRCEIYAVRPLDCRIFPFDIIEDADEELRWIVYTDLCPVDFDYRPAYKNLKNFFDLPEDLAWVYCESDAPGMESNAYIKLGRVYKDG